jgi:sugar phosphate isomerase/epimerase
LKTTCRFCAGFSRYSDGWRLGRREAFRPGSGRRSACLRPNPPPPLNHPNHDVVEEIAWMADMGLEFLDLSLEPPAAASWKVNPRAIRAALERHGMKVVGHTAFYLPVANSFELVRKAAVEELCRCLRIFGEVGARWMNIHPDRYTPFHDRAFFISRNLESLRELLPEAERQGVGLMVENLPGEFNDAHQLGELLDPLSELGLHLDFGHAQLLVPHDTSEEILARYASRLRHVHLHDNKGGGEDMHAPVNRTVRSLKGRGYDGTITLEVFTPDRHYLQYSRDVLQRAWHQEQATA